MRILLTANASYVPPRGGATRSNLVWLEILAAGGHECRVVAPALSTAVVAQQARDEETERRWSRASASAGVDRLERNGVTVYAVADRTRVVACLRDQFREFAPDWVIVSSEDLGHVLLREAARSAAGRIIYLAHTPQFFPFGPASWNQDAEATDVVRRAAAVIAIGHHTAAYIRRHTGREAEVIHPPVYGSGPYPNLAAFDSGLVTMINPCAMKGISIFLALADRFPQQAFGVLPGWGTTAADRRDLAQRPNITLLPNVRNIEQFLRRTRVLLMPSLWYEGFGLSVMEAMLRGIPTISSDSGGLAEAKTGTRYVIPGGCIERFLPVFDEHGMPKPVLPALDIDQWALALDRLLTSPQEYQAEAERSRAAALAFVETIRPDLIVDFLASLEPAAPSEPSARELPRAEALSPEKRALLLKRLREKAAGRNPS
jgi:glycosyltransferase involved in cell wall biosynthesis